MNMQYHTEGVEHLPSQEQIPTSSTTVVDKAAPLIEGNFPTREPPVVKGKDETKLDVCPSDQKSLLREFFSNSFRWRSGRQGSGYEKMLILHSYWPVPFDCYLIRYPVGSSISPHIDPVPNGKHFRLNLILHSPNAGGEFTCDSPLFETSRIKFFRPDICEHSVSTVEGSSRYVLSIGWIW
jgi:hypothetical protein